jgi:phosphatidylserine/phosphatidylglycerophosphate/cardiolipin synthase-like enzyme
VNRSLLHLAVALTALSAGCASLPPQNGRVETRAVTETAATSLGRAVSPRVAGNPGKSGFHALTSPSDAFAARVLLASASEKSLDLQYYIWHGDQTGYLLFEAVWRAAARGVRVRILLDDANTAGLDETIAALDAHPNIEVRLYNPLMQRGVRWLNFVTDFMRANRRMHNKSFTADNQVAIVGGRNVGNEYFGAGEGAEFTDLDVLAIGPSVHEVSSEFDLYWNSASAYPAAAIVGTGETDGAHRLEAQFAATRADPQTATYLDVLRTTALVRELIAGRLPFEWATAELVRDDPSKTLDVTERKDVLLLSTLLPALGRPATSFDLVSPYFVPGDDGTAALVQLARRGVAVRVLTNSLAATDVAPVHAGYAKRRCDLLRAGVKLYELKPSAAPRSAPDSKVMGSSSSVQLHAKTFAVDRARIFVGSFNFDPRSAFLNTEMGLVIDSPALASRLSAAFDTKIPQDAYTLRVAADGRCPEWIERTPDGERFYDVDPGTGAAKRAWIQFLTILPIEWLL